MKYLLVFFTLVSFSQSKTFEQFNFSISGLASKPTGLSINSNDFGYYSFILSPELNMFENRITLGFGLGLDNKYSSIYKSRSNYESFREQNDTLVRYITDINRKTETIKYIGEYKIKFNDNNWFYFVGAFFNNFINNVENKGTRTYSLYSSDNSDEETLSISEINDSFQYASTFNYILYGMGYRKSRYSIYAQGIAAFSFSVGVSISIRE